MKRLLLLCFLALPAVASEPGTWFVHAQPVKVEAVRAEIKVNEDIYPCVDCFQFVDDTSTERVIVSDISHLVPDDLTFTVQIRLCTDSNCGVWVGQGFDCNDAIDVPCLKLLDAPLHTPGPPINIRVAWSQ